MYKNQTCIKTGQNQLKANPSPLSSMIFLLPPLPPLPKIVLAGRVLVSPVDYCKNVQRGAHLMSQHKQTDPGEVGCGLLLGCGARRWPWDATAAVRLNCAGVIPTPKTENSLLLTANTFLLCSLGVPVSKRGTQITIFPLLYENIFLYWGRAINSLALSLRLWECFCKQGFWELSGVFFKAQLFCFLSSLKMDWSPVLPGNQKEFLQLQKQNFQLLWYSFLA